MANIDELGSVGILDSRIRDTTELANNEQLLQKQFLALLGLDVDQDGKLIARTTKYQTEEGNIKILKTKPLMSFEGAIRFLDTILGPYLSNLSAFTTLSDRDIRMIARSASDEAALWLYSHRTEYEIDSRDIGYIVDEFGNLIFMQLSRSARGESNMVLQVMGNSKRDYVIRNDGDNVNSYTDMNAGPQKKRWWNFGGLVGR